jgi:hypothetical protein
MQNLSPTNQTQLVMRDVFLWCNALKRHRNNLLGREMRKKLSEFMAASEGEWAREWYFEEYCFAVHYLSEEDVAWQAVSQLLDAVDWSTVRSTLLTAFQETRVMGVA